MSSDISERDDTPVVVFAECFRQHLDDDEDEWVPPTKMEKAGDVVKFLAFGAFWVAIALLACIGMLMVMAMLVLHG